MTELARIEMDVESELRGEVLQPQPPPLEVVEDKMAQMIMRPYEEPTAAQRLASQALSVMGHHGYIKGLDREQLAQSLRV